MKAIVKGIFEKIDQFISNKNILQRFIYEKKL